MKKHLVILSITLFPLVTKVSAQVDSFSKFTYQPAEFFAKSDVPSGLQFKLSNNDTGFCIITLYKCQPAKDSVIHDVKNQWNEYVLKQLEKADKKPTRIYTQQLWDG